MVANRAESNAEARQEAVWGLLRFVNELGSATERFFERIYRGLSRKRPGSAANLPPPDSDQVVELRRANRDLSNRVKEARTVAARMEAVFARIDEGVIMQTPEGRIVLANEAALKLLGSIKSFWDSELGRMFKTAQEHAADRGSEIDPIGKASRVQVNDRILGAQLAAVNTPDGEPLGTLIVLRDVTREALADRLKDQFVTALTHELRTPLTAIKGMSEVLLNTPEGKPLNRKFLETIARNTATVDRMISELLDISEITAGSFSVRRQEVVLAELVLDLLKGREQVIKKADLNVSIMAAGRAHTKILGDDRRLSWAIGHLIDNSINYTLKGGFLTIRIGAVRGQHVLIDVIDSGVGISDRDLAHIFERFYRGEARTAEGKLIDPRGLGQGLYIARAVAEAHGGYLVATSSVGEGSKFTLGLPR